MKNRILVIEDDKDISDVICMNLEAAGYAACPVYDGRDARRMIEGAGADRGAEREAGMGADRPVAGGTAKNGPDYDLALLDLMLPGEDGLSLLEPLKAQGIPAICLTARGDLSSKVQGFKLGAEDYLVKPFEMLELLVRMEKVLERTGKRREEILFQDMKVDLARRRVWEHGQEVHLRPTEFQLLTVFLQNPNRILKRDWLLDQVWGTDFPGETRTVDVHVAKLRKKLSACGAIVTVPKGGYLVEGKL